MLAPEFPSRHARILAAWSGFLLFLGGTLCHAQSTLFYLEVQNVVAYSTAARAVQLFSLAPDEAMQKPSLGFDFVERITGASRDYGVIAVQARVAYDQQGDHHVELQVYNAYFRLKAGFADIWAGHNRPAWGISYELDNHALLLETPEMMGFGFERDWGVGLHRDLSWGDAAFSLTAGSGMPLYFKGNYFAAARVSKGVLARDNYSLGLSLAHGDILNTMGYHLLMPEPVDYTAAAADATYFWRNIENRVEAIVGRKAGADILVLFWRAGLNLLEEGRLKLEVQPVLTRGIPSETWQLGGCATYRMTADLAARCLVQYDRGQRDARFVLQLYYYKGV